MSRKRHVYAVAETPPSPDLFNMPQNFKTLTIPEKLQLFAETSIESGVPDLSDKYEMVSKVGQGTFGTVYKAREKGTNNFVALKRVPTDTEFGGFPLTSVREIRIMQELKHTNILKLIEIFKMNAKTGEVPYIYFLMLEYCDHNLEDLLKETRVNMTLAMRKSVMQQLLNGLYFMHFSNILHRDIKAANILITKAGVVKIADFGLARSLSLLRERLQKPKTNCVVTLWYRAPELLLGARNYTAAIDLWSAGCVMAELWTRSAILAGNSEKDQIVHIINLCGSFTKTDWPDIVQLPLYNSIEFPSNVKRRVRERLGQFVQDNHALNLIDKLLALDPKKRINADYALNHKFFWDNPLPASLAPILHNYRRLKMEQQVAANVAENYRGYMDRVF